MKTYVLALAAVAAMTFAGAAYASDATAPKAMSDSEMDKVTAGQPTTDVTLFNFGQSSRNGGDTCCTAVLLAKPNDAALANGQSHQGQGDNAARIHFVAP